MFTSISRHFRASELNVFAEMVAIKQLAYSAVANGTYFPRVSWDDSDPTGQRFVFDGHPLLLSEFRQMYSQLLKRTSIQLKEEVLLGLQPPSLKHTTHIYDDFENKSIDYGFISDRRNDFHHHAEFLLKTMFNFTLSGNRFIYPNHTNDSGIVWNLNGVKQYFRLCENFLGNLFALCHLGSGAPARGTELTHLTFINTVLRTRNVFWYKSLVVILTYYNKTQANRNKERAILRALPPPVGDILIEWLTFVVPALKILAICSHDSSTIGKNVASDVSESMPDGIARISNTLFTGIDAHWDTEDLSSVLTAITRPLVAEGGIGLPMGMSKVRHFLLAVLRRYTKDQFDRLHLSEILIEEQSGHDEETGTRYAVDAGSIHNVTTTRLDGFVATSQTIHQLLGLSNSDSESDKAVSRHARSQEPLSASTDRTPYLDPQFFASRVAAEIVPAIAPYIQRYMADGFAATSATVIKLRTHQPTHQTTHQPIRAGFEAGAQVIDLESIEIDPQRYSELRKILGEEAHFRSRAQVVALELSSRRDKDLLIVLATGKGKSIVFIATGFNIQENKLTTVVVVPLRALLRETYHALKRFGVPVDIWSDSRSYFPDRGIVLISAEGSVSDIFRRTLRVKIQERRVARMVLEEIHVIMTSDHYRPLLTIIRELRQLQVPFVGLTATLPPMAVKTMMEKLAFSPETTQIIRDSTIRKELIYNIFASDLRKNTFTEQGKTHNISYYIQNIMSSFRQDDRTIVFCLTKADAAHFAALLDCDAFTADLSEKEQEGIIGCWKTGTKRVITATSCLGAGFDYPHVRLVVHYGEPRSIIDYAQESGRGGRDGNRTYCTVFFDEQSRAAPPKDDQDITGIAAIKQWVRKRQCRRLILSESLDGYSDTCLNLGDVALCDFCEEEVLLSVSTFQSSSSYLNFIGAAAVSHRFDGSRRCGPLKL